MFKKISIFLITLFFFFLFYQKINAQTNLLPTKPKQSVFQQQQQQNTKQTPTNIRYAACDFCGFCPPNPPPQSWLSCKKCLYPNLSDDPSTMETLKIDPKTNLPPTPQPGKQYTFFGCLGSSSSFSEEGSAGSVVQSILNIVFSIAGGIAFLYFIYGAFIIATSQSDPEKLNYGKRIVTGAIVGLIFTISSVFIVNFIASGVLKLPGFGNQ